jgi:GT2 family glycosyltransferase
MRDIALIVPSYGHWDYVSKAVNSFFAHTPGDNVCYVIDDCSPTWCDAYKEQWPPHVVTQDDLDKRTLLYSTPKDINPLGATGNERTLFYHYTTHSGLTRSWNMGLRIGLKSGYWGAKYTICGNSDIVFTPNWFQPMAHALEEYDLVGPVTNASGRVFQQNIKRFVPRYKLSDDPQQLAGTSNLLASQYSGKLLRVSRINGFFMMAKTATWWSLAHDEDHVFNPAWPMDNVAYDLQKLFRHAGKKIGLVPSSFILHYRSVSRGRRGLAGQCGRGAFRARKS